MQFKFPDHKVGDKVWFLSDTDRVTFATVDMITIVLKGDQGIGIWYGLNDETGKGYTAKESQVLDNQTRLRQPKYNVGEEVAYEYKDADDRAHYDTGLITNIMISLEEGIQDIKYVFDDNHEYWATEDEILCLAETPSVATGD